MRETRRSKRKMKNNDQWVPVRKKSKRKAGKASAAKKTNLVKEEEEMEEEIVSVAEPEEAMEEPSDSKLASSSIKSCTVRIEKIGS